MTSYHRRIVVVVFTLLACGVAGPARADLVRVGDVLRLSAQLPEAPPGADVARLAGAGYDGGPFKLSNLDTGDEWVTFCVERAERVSHGGEYRVAAVSDRTSSGARLTPAAEWLYEQFRFGGGFDGLALFSGATFDRTLGAHTRILQHALWLAMGYPDGFGAGAAAIDLAAYAAGPGLTTTGRVRIVQLVKADGSPAQDQLALRSIPEPAASLLVGLGLAGLARAVRRRRRASQ